MLRRFASFLVVVPWLLAAAPLHAQTAPCQFILGFKTLHDMDAADVGTCQDNQTFAANGDAQQHTTAGLMAWRKADNWTAFTNGYWTWINGPNGLAMRLNTERFSWEANPDKLPVKDSQGAAPSVVTKTWANSLAAKYASIGGMAFHFTASADTSSISTITLTLANEDLYSWIKLPSVLQRQTAMAILQDVKAHWNGLEVMVTVQSAPYHTFTYDTDSMFVFQDHTNIDDNGWFTIARLAIASYSSSTGDTIETP